MIQILIILQALSWVPLSASAFFQQPQLVSPDWNGQIIEPQQQLQTQQAERQPITADLQNQVNALSTQIAAANRQLQYFQQQLSLVNSQRAQQVQAQPAQVAPQPTVQVNGAEQPTDNQFYAQLQLQQQQQQLLQQQQQQQQPRVSTLIDEAELADARLGQRPARLYYPPTNSQRLQAAQQQPQFDDQAELRQAVNQPAEFERQPATSTTVSPPAIENSLSAQDVQLPPVQLPSSNSPPPHNPPRNDDKFSIGLGVLSPGYTQKFGNTALDFNQDKNGFSFTLSNNGHSNQPQTVQQSKPN